MKTGLHIGNFSWPVGVQAISVRNSPILYRWLMMLALKSLTLMDHLFQLGDRYGEINGPWEEPMLEGYTSLSYLAAKTTRIKFGLLATCPFFRAPGLLVKMVSTLDVLSEGCALLPIGAGWFEEEADGLDIPYPKHGQDVLDGWRRPSKSYVRCGIMIKHPLLVNSYNCKSQLIHLCQSVNHILPSLFVGVERKRHCGLWQSMQMRPIWWLDRPINWIHSED